MRTFSFTKTSLDALTSTGARKSYRDTKANGLEVIVQANGRKSFSWLKRVNGKLQRKTIGGYPELNVEQARARANELNTKSAKWRATEFEGPNPFEVHEHLTLGGLFELYISQQLRQHAMRPEIAEDKDRRMFNNHLSRWKDRQLSQIHREDVARLHREIPVLVAKRSGRKESGTYMANEVVRMVKKLYYFGEESGNWTGSNPTVGVKLFHHHSRERFAQPDELAKIWTALNRSRNPDLRDFVNLALWTGARKSDILSMRWDDIYIMDGRGRWGVPDPKNRQPYNAILDAETVKILEARKKFREQNNPWVFPATRFSGSGHRESIQAAWGDLLRDAGLKESKLRVHDLRRTQASYQAIQGTSLLLIGASLGHKDTRSTAIYAKLQLDAARDSVVQANTTMRTLMQGSGENE